MGCSAAKNITVEPLNGNAVTDNNQIKQEAEPIKPPSVSCKAADVLILDSEEPQTEILENVTMNNVQRTSNGLSFDLEFDDDDKNESIIKKYPPKRLQKLEEHHPENPPVSLEQLQEKLEEAEERRKQILQQRMESARNSFRKQSSVFSIDDVDFQKLSLPEESQGHNNVPAYSENSNK